MFIYAISICILINTVVNGIEWGGCPSYTVQKNFDIKQYLGKWYQHASINTYFQGHGKCIFAIYNTTEDSSEISVHNQQIMIDTNATRYVDGKAVLENPSSGEGKLIVTLYPLSWFKVSGSYWVLGTDYSNYAIVYSCKSWLWVLHSSTYWILTRDQVISSTQLKSILLALENSNLKYSDFELANQSDC